MSDERTIYVRVSKIRNVWARRAVILGILPLMILGNLVLVLAAIIPYWMRNNLRMVDGCREQWRRKP